MSSFTHDELVEIGRKWLLRPWVGKDGHGHSACSVILTEITTGAWESPDVLGWNGHFSVLLEAKVSRADFLKDKKKSFRGDPGLGMGRQRYFIVPSKLITVDELPKNWGLIEVSPKGKTRVKHNSSVFETRASAEITVLLSLIRRLKVEPGKHVSIRAYTIDNGKEPKATVTLKNNVWDDPCALGHE